MTAPAPASDPPEVTPRWGLGDAVAGWLVAETMAVLASGILLSATGHLDAIAQAPLDILGKVLGHPIDATVTPLWLIAILQAFLWVGLLGAPLLATGLKGNGAVRDLGLRFELTDVPLGIAAGLASQYILAPLLSSPWIWLLGRHPSELQKPAQELADKATDPVGAVLLVLIVVIGAPFVEELFFRGLLQRSLLRDRGPVVAVAVSSVVFGLTHFELLQFPALAGFGVVLGVLAVRTGRLGPGIFAHLSFNAATVIYLLYQAHS